MKVEDLCTNGKKIYVHPSIFPCRVKKSLEEDVCVVTLDLFYV